MCIFSFHPDKGLDNTLTYVTISSLAVTMGRQYITRKIMSVYW